MTVREENFSNGEVMLPKKEGMQVVVIDRFGGPEVLLVRSIVIPKLRPDHILIRVESAGIGAWDISEREGRLAKLLRIEAKFPWILGSEGAGKVVAVGDKVSKFKIGDLVYGHAWAKNPKGGFYAEYAAVDADDAWHVPSNLTPKKAGALLIDGATSLKAVDDILGLKPEEKLMIFGASGGLGHFTIQLAKRFGARVFAIASGNDGLALAQRLEAEAAVDGHDGDLAASARKFAPNGFDAALIPVAGEAAENSLTMMREGGRVAFPWTSQRPAPKASPTIRLFGFNVFGDDGNIDRDLVRKLNKLIELGPFEVHLGKTFSLDQIADAYQALGSHYLGRLALLPGNS